MASRGFRTVSVDIYRSDVINRFIDGYGFRTVSVDIYLRNKIYSSNTEDGFRTVSVDIYLDEPCFYCARCMVFVQYLLIFIRQG